MTKKLLVITEEVYKAVGGLPSLLAFTGDESRARAQIEGMVALRAAMTEVDLDEILGEWINGVVEDGGKPFSSHVLAHMEGK